MKPVFLVLIFSVSSMAVSGMAAAQTFVSDASRVVGTFDPGMADHSPAAMAAAANAFLDSLNDEQRKLAAHPLDSPERREWTNLPVRPTDGGLRLGDCTERQIKAALRLMAAVLSEQGYTRMCQIMLADDQLLNGGRPRPGFGTENFAIVIFGSPTATDPWAFQLDGHHVGVNLAMQGEKLTMSPSFIGTQPEAFRLANKSIRPLSGSVDGAFRLIATLTAEQRAQAVLTSRRGSLKTGPGTDGQVPQAKGVSAASFSDEQQKLLMSLIANWVNDAPPPHADQRMTQIRSEIDQLRFSWNGPVTANSDVSYTIQGPTLIIEYACQDIGGNPLDHIHTMYRDPTNEYGGQLK